MGFFPIIIGLFLVFLIILLIVAWRTRNGGRSRSGPIDRFQLPSPGEGGQSPSVTLRRPKSVISHPSSVIPPLQKERMCTHCMGRGKMETNCHWCHGMGRKTCGGCGGSGGMMRSVYEFGKYVTKRVNCTSCGGSGRQMCSCGGSGKTYSGSCPYCHGTGKMPIPSA